jgi:hypothetical protein
MDIFWQIVSSILGLFGVFGGKMIDNIEKPVLKIVPFVDKREWKYDGVTSDEKPVYYGGTVSPNFIQIPGKLKEPRYFAHLAIKNNTKYRGRNSTAKRLFAKLNFYNADFSKKLLSDVYGRWAESIEPPMALDKDSLKYIDVLPGDTKTLDLASRYYSRAEWYAVSTESYTADQFENSMLLVRENFLDRMDSFGIGIEINGENIKINKRFIVSNRGSFGEPRISEHSDEA